MGQPGLAWPSGGGQLLAVWLWMCEGRGKAEHCFIESVQFLLPAQGGGVLVRQPEEVEQEEEAEQERHPAGAARRGRDRQDERGELLLAHLTAQLLRLPPAEPANGLQALREHLPQRGESELTQCGAQPRLSAHVHRAGPPAARPHHQRHAAARGEIRFPLCSVLRPPAGLVLGCIWSLGGRKGDEKDAGVCLVAGLIWSIVEEEEEEAAGLR